MMSDLNQFLSEVQARAYRMAFSASRNHADALDIVQDAMTKLVQYYSNEPADTWPKLFQRILQNRITDNHRFHSKIIKLFVPSKHSEQDANELDYTDESAEGGAMAIDPSDVVASAQQMDSVLALVSELPIRQQQVFMLRMLEQFDVLETAEVLNCSVSSVKTHYGRALLKIRTALTEE